MLYCARRASAPYSRTALPAGRASSAPSPARGSGSARRHPPRSATDPLNRTAHLQTLPNGIVTRPGSRNDILADDCDVQRAFSIRIGERPAPQDANLKCFEIVGVNRFEVERRIRRRIGCCLSRRHEPRDVPPAKARERRHVDRRCRRDRWRRLEPHNQLIEKTRLVCRIPNLGPGTRSMNTRRSADSPRSVAWSFSRLRVSKPAPATTMTASPTWAATSARRPSTPRLR